jgi:hypothetical protein
VNEELELLLRAAFIGVGATIAMDLWALLLRHLFALSSLNYAMVGRWIGHLTHGRFAHASIAQATPVPAERAIGWTAHYAIGVLFATLLLAIYGLDWARRPTLAPALIIGLSTLVAPFLVMQPGMGLGIAASKTPQPNVARLRSVATHLIFGLGLYASALLLAALIESHLRRTGFSGR